MQAVILCAGKSTRTYPLTAERPKPLLKVANKTILEHNLDALRGLVDEVILIVGFKKEMIEDFAEKIKNRLDFKITLVEQKEQLGTGHALLAAEPCIKGRFIVLMGDNIYSSADIKNCLESGLGMLVTNTKTPEIFGTIKKGKNGFLEKIYEKTDRPPSNLANTGLYVLDRKVFGFKTEKTVRGEIELTDMVNELAKTEKIAVVLAEGCWLPIGYPWEILDANEYLLKKIKMKINGLVEKNATIKGQVVIGKNTVVKNGSYIEGPVIIGENCEIGPNCYIRAYTSIGDNCKIGNAVEIKNSVVMDSTKIGHLSYFGDSVIGFSINIGAGTITSNLRHDCKSVRSVVKGKLMDTERKKFGAVIGDRVHTGINTLIYPGRKIWPGLNTLPGEIVKEDKEG
jgi:bifunctional UDP-N-acetylglucosamine pyrophosphorylase/glucosamine-1-phosphate N-acetyltransferase